MAQEDAFGIKVSGFIKNDFFYDSRQVVSLREGHFLLYPSPVITDMLNTDFNDDPSFNFLSIQTRVTGNITAPDAFGARVTGVLEADFFGNENSNFVDGNGFRLRHAFAKLNWKNTEILFGQYWHPFFIPGNYSEVLSFNTGAPFQPFARNPQIRVTQKLASFRFIGAAAAQRDFTSPDGSTVLRNSMVPDLHAQLNYENNIGSGIELFTGAGSGYKVLRLSEVLSFPNFTRIVKQNVDGLSWTAFLKLKFPSMVFKLQATYGENLYDATMLGGYTISRLIKVIEKTEVEYTTIDNFAIWSEVITKIKNVELALWGGYTKNLGSGKEISEYRSYGVRGSDIKTIYRLSPRVVFTSPKLNIGVETEYTDAAYAVRNELAEIARDSRGKITETYSVSNLRLLLAVTLKF